MQGQHNIKIYDSVSMCTSTRNSIVVLGMLYPCETLLKISVYSTGLLSCVTHETTTDLWPDLLEILYWGIYLKVCLVNLNSTKPSSVCTSVIKCVVRNVRLVETPDAADSPTIVFFFNWATWKLPGETMLLCWKWNKSIWYEMIYHLDAIEYLFVFFQLDMFRAYTPIFRSNGCYNFFTYAAYGVLGAVQHATSTHTPQDRHLTTPRTPYAAYVKKL